MIEIKFRARFFPTIPLREGEVEALMTTAVKQALRGIAADGNIYFVVFEQEEYDPDAYYDESCARY